MKRKCHVKKTYIIKEIGLSYRYKKYWWLKITIIQINRFIAVFVILINFEVNCKIYENLNFIFKLLNKIYLNLIKNRLSFNSQLKIGYESF